MDINTKHSLPAAGIPPHCLRVKGKAASPVVVTPSSDVLGHQGWLKTGTKHLTTETTSDLERVVNKRSVKEF